MTRRLELLAYLYACWQWLRENAVQWLAYMYAVVLVLVVYATGSWWAAVGLAGLFLIPTSGRRQQ